MNNKKIKMALAGLMSGFSLSASAWSLGFENSIEDFKEYDWKGASYEEVQGQLSAYSDFMKNASSNDDYRLYEKWLVEFIYESYPGMTSYWNDAYVFEDMRVVHADSLIDLERNIVGKANMGARMHSGSAQYSPRISDGAEYPELKTSLTRMRSGLAPIGPDNKPLLLCKLNDDARATYFEVAESESWKLLNTVGSGMTKAQACLEEAVIPYYWKDRAENLFNKRERVIRSKRNDIK